jgi:hypothetical protein
MQCGDTVTNKLRNLRKFLFEEVVHEISIESDEKIISDMAKYSRVLSD